jgi:hypothetical protein
MRSLIKHNRRNLGGLLAVLFLLVPAAKSSRLELTFTAGANVGDGGTITTDGCSTCGDSDFTGFDFKLLGFEFTPLSSFVRVSGTGSLLGDYSVNFLATATYPDLFLFDNGAFGYVADSVHAEEPAPGDFLLVPATIPEPSSLALILAALLPLGFAARFRNNPTWVRKRSSSSRF